MRKLLTLVAFFASFSACFSVDKSAAQSITINLKPHQPNWRSEVVEHYPEGQPKSLVYYEPFLKGEQPAKQVFLFPNGRIQAEMDVVEVGKDSAAYKEWKSIYVPNGSRVDLSDKGELLRLSNYVNGVLEGETKIFFPNGKLQTNLFFKQGKLEGVVQVFDENGQLREKANYVNGEIEGELIRYHENGSKAMILPHHKGKIEGTATEWFPSGSVKSQRQFAKGVLHGSGKSPALIIYDEERNVIEVADFREGEIVGTHLTYYKNGKESHRIPYKNGKRDGKEQFFTEDGIVLGEGYFQDGNAVGKHWRNHSDGGLAYLAEFDSKGNLLKPIIEFNEEGQKIREFSLAANQLNGPATEWYPNGNLKAEFNYVQGMLEGEQKEYYPSGQIKLLTHYQNKKREGVYEEWHENGVLARRCQFAEDLKDGQSGEWYLDGTPKSDGYFIMDHPDGIHSEWYANGQLKHRFEFACGLREGWHREWNEQGILLSEAFYIKDLLDGAVLAWWDKDQIKSRFMFEKGKKTGTHQVFSAQGQLLKMCCFKNDLLDGELRAWFPDGSLQSVQNYKEGKPIGLQVEYYQKTEPSQKEVDRICKSVSFNSEGKIDGEEKTNFPNGHPQAIISHLNGSLHGLKRIWNEQGILIEEGNYVQGKLEGRYFQRLPDRREVVYHFQNNLKNGPFSIAIPGKEPEERIILLKANYENDLLQGLVCEYNEKGDKISEMPYIAGLKEGLSKVYAPDGKLNATIEWVNDRKNGWVVQYFSDGTIFRETPYVNDKKQGEERTYFENGVLASICNYQDDVLYGLSQSWNQQQILVFEGEYQNGMRHGKFNKFYDNGNPYIEQHFSFDKLEGAKRKYDLEGNFTVSYYSKGDIVKTVR